MKKYYPYVERFELASALDDIYEATIAVPYILVGDSISYHRNCIQIFGERQELAERCKKLIDAHVIEI